MKVSPRTLLALAALMWLAAGVNVAVIGLKAYGQTFSWLLVAGSLMTFGVFGLLIFWPLVGRHRARIAAMTGPQASWSFFDRKSFLIMALMIALGVGLRASGLAPLWFVAFFYTGLGAALALAGLGFGWAWMQGL